MAPDGPAGELTRGWVDEPGDFVGLQDPDGPEVGVVLPEPQPPVGADDRQPFVVMTVDVEGVVGDLHTRPLPLGESDESAALRQAAESYVFGLHEYTSSDETHRWRVFLCRK